MTPSWKYLGWESIETLIAKRWLDQGDMVQRISDYLLDGDWEHYWESSPDLIKGLGMDARKEMWVADRMRSDCLCQMENTYWEPVAGIAYTGMYYDLMANALDSVDWQALARFYIQEWHSEKSLTPRRQD